MWFFVCPSFAAVVRTRLCGPELWCGILKDPHFRPREVRRLRLVRIAPQTY